MKRVIEVKLEADRGHYLTNGKIYVKSVRLAPTADESTWYEITESEYEAILDSIEEARMFRVVDIETLFED